MADPSPEPLSADAIYFVIHDASGRILRAGNCRRCDLALQQSGTGETAIEADAFYHPDRNYLIGGKVTARPALTATVDKTSIKADGTDEATISGLPNPTTLRVRGPHGVTSATVTDGSFVLTTTWAGQYVIDTGDVWPALPGRWVINAA